MNEESTQPVDADPEIDGGNARLVPVAESIKYRRRAQQAETRLTQLEQQLNDLQANAQQHSDSLAQAEAQRDEARSRLIETENRLTAERMLSAAGVVDLETAALLLAKRVDLTDDVEPDGLTLAVEQLLLDKPFLRSRELPLPGKTASQRSRANPCQIAHAAERAMQSGDRRDVAEYLRLRRAATMTGRKK